MRIHETRVVSSNPTRVTIKTPLVRKAAGNHLIKSTFLEKKRRALSLVSATFKLGHVTQLIYHCREVLNLRISLLCNYIVLMQDDEIRRAIFRLKSYREVD